MSEVAGLNLEVRASSQDAIQALNALGQALDALKAKVEKKVDVSSGVLGATAKRAKEILDPIQEKIAESAQRTVTVSRQMGESLKSFSQNLFSVNPAASSFKSAMTNMLGPIGTFGSALFRIAKYRFIRTVIKEITQGIHEGLTNLYHYSDAIGSQFANDIDSATSAMLRLKNSIGAAVAPALQALIPILQTIVSWVITALNAINQFLSLLTGKSQWTRAKEASAGANKALGGTGKAAKEATEDIKGLLAAWDELNIIQQDSSKNPSGGSGGGGAGGLDYESMFEEVSQFDAKIRKLVNWIKSHFDEILDIAKLIGAAVLAWKVSTAFGGILGTLAGLAAAGLVIAVVWKMSALFNGEYLRTGEPGWLIADALTTMLGAYITQKILGSVLSSGAANIAIPLTLAVSAAAGIYTYIKNTDVSALSKEGLIDAIWNAAKVGVGTGVALWKFTGMLPGEAVLGGAGAALVTFGVAVGVKAIAAAVRNEDFNKDTLISLALSSLTFGTGVAMGAHALGMTWLTAAGLGGGAALVIAAVGVGIKAVAQAVGSGIKKPMLIDTALSSLGMGIGAGLISVAAGATFGTAAAIGVGAGIATLAVIFGLTAILGTDRDTVKWGNESLTKEQAQNFAKNQMFEVDVPATVNIIGDSIAISEDQREKIQSDLVKALTEFNVIKLGLAEKQDYSNLNEAINGSGGLIETVSGYIEEAKRTGKLTLQFTPELAGSDAQDASSWFSTYTTGWDKVDDFVKAKGTEIGKLLAKAEAEGISESESEVLAALMKQLSDVTNAIANADISAKAFSNMKIGLGDMTKTSVDDVIKAFGEYKEELRQGYESLVQEQYIRQGELVAALFAIDPTSAEYEKALAEYERMGENLTTAVDEGVAKASQQGADMVVKLLQERYAQKLSSFKFDKGGYFDALALLGYGPDDIEKGVEGFASALRTALAQSTGIKEAWLSALGDKDVWNLLPETVQGEIANQLANVFGSEGAKKILSSIGVELSEELAGSLGDAGETVEQFADTVAESTSDTADSLGDVTEKADEAAGSVNKYVEAVKQINEQNGLGEAGFDLMEAWKLNIETESQAIVQAIGDANAAMDSIPDEIKTPDGSGYINFITNIANATIEGANAAIGALEALFSAAQSMSNVSVTMSSGSGSGLDPYHYIKGYAAGGVVTTGQMFIAREAGPEYVGTMGNHTAVANNEQIVTGIASGVASANAEQNALLRQQNSLLTQLLNKEFTAKAVPSSAWGRFQQQSSDMYARQTGRG